jgi:hypothetical protein
MTESQTYSRNQANPTGIWQTIWANLFMQSIEEITAKQYIHAFNTLEILKSQIPPECETEIEEVYKTTKLIVEKKVVGHNLNKAQENKIAQIQTELRPAVLNLMAKIRNSLYNKHWINKQTGFVGLDPNQESDNIA